MSATHLEHVSHTHVSMPTDGRVRAVIDAVLPSVDGGRFAAKCIAGEPFRVEAHCFADGHDALRVMLHWHQQDSKAGHEVEMRAQGNDVWLASFTPAEPGTYAYTVQAWVDGFLSWRTDFKRRQDDADIRLALRIGAGLLEEAAERAQGMDRSYLQDKARTWHTQAADCGIDAMALLHTGLDEAVGVMAGRYPDRRFASLWPTELPLVADRPKARFSTWYEMFPRSASLQPGEHGRLSDVVQRLPYVAAMGFDVLYLPPIHPIGRDKRKGRNNAPQAQPGDVGSPWAIGAAEGGHKAIHPELGTLRDFRTLVARAAEANIEIALDIAFQCAPDHPYVNEHKDWFRWRPDGTVQYAENPPKKYQDIYPFNFETKDWPAMWLELKSVFDFWIKEGVHIFRVDNPHTKSFAFWEWAIAKIKSEHPDVLFLSEAFTRPKVMHRLAKLGFTQSYTYFTWRQTAQELKTYFDELANGPGKDYFRPNAWPNTPDIFHEQLHHGGPAIFGIRLVLAATLSSSYGIYGPAYELMDKLPLKPGSEEYLDSEKYQLRHWGELSLARPDSLADFIARINRIRHDNPALQAMAGLHFHTTDNEQLLAYSKQAIDPRSDNVILSIVNLDAGNTQSGWVTLDLARIGLPHDATYEVYDLLNDQRFVWHGSRNFVMLDPGRSPAHVMRIRRPLPGSKETT
jgi:starch synthase (maltosyl-transferring)